MAARTDGRPFPGSVQHAWDRRAWHTLLELHQCTPAGAAAAALARCCRRPASFAPAGALCESAFVIACQSLCHSGLRWAQWGSTSDKEGSLDRGFVLGWFLCWVGFCLCWVGFCVGTVGGFRRAGQLWDSSVGHLRQGGLSEAVGHLKRRKRQDHLVGGRLGLGV
jgi:hypothetical protein